MPTFRSFAEFGQALERMEKDVNDKTRLVAVAMAEKAQQIATAQASGDLGGDPKFSGWAPSLDLHVKSIRTGAILLPTRSGAGPWRVAEQGRHMGNAGGFSGPGINRRTGKTSRTKSGAVRSVRASKGKRWNGSTRGFNTAGKAVARMDRELPPIAERGVKAIIQRHFDVS